MKKIKTIKGIKPNYDKSLVFTRLGYSKSKTEMSAGLNSEIERLLSLTEKTMDIISAYRIVDIASNNSPQIILEDGTALFGQKLSALLHNCDQALIMLATGGKRIMELINKLQWESKMSDAIVVDAVASEITDSALNVVMSHVEQSLRSSGRAVTRMRFSPGYGDFDIQHQRELYRILEADSFGITINDACLLIPEKSVFAIAGIGRMQG